MKSERLFRCAECGGWRYYLSRPCRTCTILRNRQYLGRA
jgi:hypothetical protein